MSLSAPANEAATTTTYGPLLSTFDDAIANADADFNHDLLDMLRKALMDIDGGSGSCSVSAFRLAIYASPVVSKDNNALMALYPTADSLERGIRVTGKPGKLLRKLAPQATDVQVAAFSELYRDAYVNSTANMTVKIGETKEDFTRVYTQQVAAGDPKLGKYKSLAHSCMRYSFSNLSGHPSSVYASGDFKILSIEDASANILARAVVAVEGGRYAAGPIYTSSTPAALKLEQYICEQQAKRGHPESKSWLGCRLLKIDAGGEVGGYLAPYLDQCDCMTEGEETEYFTISQNGPYNACNIDGTLSCDYAGTCETCSLSLDEYEMFFSEGDQRVLCEGCYESSHSPCAGCSEHVSNDDNYPILGGGLVCHACVEEQNLYVETADGFIAYESAVFCETTGDHFHVDSGDYFESGGDIHCNTLKADLPHSLEMTRGEASKYYVITRTGSAFSYQLKSHLEYQSNSDGFSIVNRQLSLFS